MICCFSTCIATAFATSAILRSVNKQRTCCTKATIGDTSTDNSSISSTAKACDGNCIRMPCSVYAPSTNQPMPSLSNRWHKFAAWLATKKDAFG